MLLHDSLLQSKIVVQAVNCAQQEVQLGDIEAQRGAGYPAFDQDEQDHPSGAEDTLYSALEGHN